MKKFTLWHGFLIAVALIIVIPYGYIAYGLIWGFPDSDTVYLNKWGEHLTAEQIWEEDNKFRIQICDVAIENSDEAGMKSCVVTLNVENKDIVTHRKSRDFMTFLHYEQDGENAYRGYHGTTEEQDRQYVVKPEDKVANLMEIWINASVPDSYGNYVLVREMRKDSLLVPKGHNGTYQYQVLIPENSSSIELSLSVSANKKHTKQYRKFYILYPADYLNEVAV